MPGRHLNSLERHLKEWWDSNSGPSLRSLEIKNGTRLRGLSGVTIDFRYPFVVLAGKNGTGKSTVLACASCAYQNRSAYDLWRQGGKYFRFGDFFVTTPHDPPLDNVQVEWTYRKIDKTVEIKAVTKGASRWNGYGGLPDRVVQFVGLTRALHPAELRVLRSYFRGTGAPLPSSLSPSHVTTVSKIIGRSYQDVQVGTSGRYNLHFLHENAVCYSGFNMGSGEDVACELTEIVHRLPPNSLLVIEEIETGLHPAAQRKLVLELIRICKEKRLQVICSSHSQAVMESVPADARILLVREGTNLIPRYGVTVMEAISDMAEQPAAELCIYVEDVLGKTLVEEFLPAKLRIRVRITTCGSNLDVIRFLAVYKKDPALGHAIGILDGDEVSKTSEHLTAFAKCLGGTVSPADKEWLEKRLVTLPGGVPPEIYLRNLGNNGNFCTAVATQLNTEASTVGDFFSAPFGTDHHDLGYDLGLRIGLDSSRVEIGLCRAAAVCQAGDFQSLCTFISDRLASTD